MPDNIDPNAAAGGADDTARGPLRDAAGNEDTTARFGEEFISKMYPSGEVSPAWRTKFEVASPTPAEPPRRALAVEGRPSLRPL